jgi:hypothetical protein
LRKHYVQEIIYKHTTTKINGYGWLGQPDKHADNSTAICFPLTMFEIKNLELQAGDRRQALQPNLKTGQRLTYGGGMLGWPVGAR